MFRFRGAQRLGPAVLGRITRILLLALEKPCVGAGLIEVPQIGAAISPSYRTRSSSTLHRITKAHAHGTSIPLWRWVRCLRWPRKQRGMARENYLDDVHVRILRVTEDLRAIQRELNCAAMQVPGDPELMEALTQLPEIESLEVMKSALDQMRHFLWFYIQVMTSDSDGEDRLRPSSSKNTSAREASLIEKYSTDAALLRYIADGKNRKPN
jgi:hypothetical protein